MGYVGVAYKRTDFWAKYTVFFDPKRLFLGHIPKFFVTTMTGHHIGKFFVLNSSHGGRRGGSWGQKIPFSAPKRAILGNRGQKTAHRAAKRAPTGKPKVSRVTSGYEKDMNPLSQVSLRPKKGVIWA